MTPHADLAIIVAVADNGVIGRDGQLPWRLSADLQRFRQLTMGHALLMGRKTYQSIGRPLPGRRSIVISRNPDFVADGCQVVDCWDTAVAAVPAGQRGFAIGGRAIFALALPDATRMFWTRVHQRVDGDVFFPEVDWTAWRLEQETRHAADERNEFDYSFRDYTRQAP